MRTVVWALSTDGLCPAKDFYDGLDEKDKAKLDTLFELIASQGVIKNREKFKLLDDGLFEFKSHQVRMPCFFDSKKRVIVTHGFIKKKDNIPKAELERALDIKKNYDE